MALEIKLNQKLSQSLVMTPQLQQAIKLLQLGRVEYLEMIERELLENPVLEEIAEVESGGSRSRETAEPSILPSERAPDERETPSGNGDGKNSEFPEYYSEGSYDQFRVRRGDSDSERPSVEQTVSNPAGLASHLLWQLR